MTLLEVDGLTVDYFSGGTPRNALDDVSLTVAPGEVLGIVGESGCGKTTLSRALLRLLPANADVRAGSVRLDGADLYAMPARRFRSLRWDRISMVFQGAMNVLDPVYPVGKQIAEAIRAHRSVSRRAAWRQATELLADVNIEADRARAYPHELSGGQKQRIGIAMAMALNPALVVADEPTTALDVVTQDHVLEQLTSAQRHEGFSLIIVSHDMGVIAETCDRVAVMYAGHMVELGAVRDVFHRPAHPYTLGLINAIPRIGDTGRAVSIPGHPPADPGLEPGCRFAPRCPFREDACGEPVGWQQLTDGHGERCLFPDRRERFSVAARLPATWEAVTERLPGA